jgi:hypothetical protein
MAECRLAMAFLSWYIIPILNHWLKYSSNYVFVQSNPKKGSDRPWECPQTSPCWAVEYAPANNRTSSGEFGKTFWIARRRHYYYNISSRWSRRVELLVKVQLAWVLLVEDEGCDYSSALNWRTKIISPWIYYIMGKGSTLFWPSSGKRIIMYPMFI